MYILRTLSIRDVVAALKQRKLGVALRISQNLVSNAVNTARFRLRRRLRPGAPQPCGGLMSRHVVGELAIASASLPSASGSRGQPAAGGLRAAARRALRGRRHLRPLGHGRRSTRSALSPCSCSTSCPGGRRHVHLGSDRVRRPVADPGRRRPVTQSQAHGQSDPDARHRDRHRACDPRRQRRRRHGGHRQRRVQRALRALPAAHARLHPEEPSGIPVCFAPGIRDSQRMTDMN